MPVQGFTRLRKHQLARQAVHGTKVPATRAYPFSGVPSVNLAWTDPDVDVGLIVPTVAPQRGSLDATFPATVPQLDYNTLAALLCGVLGGHVTPTGGGDAKTWVHLPAASAPLDEQDEFTYEWGDDVVSDWYQFGDAIIESLEITGPEGLGALTATANWRLGSASSTGSTDSPVTGTVPTPSLATDRNPPIVYLKDMGIYIADTLAGLSAAQILNALHTFSMTITQEFDQKRWANGDQSFDVDEYGRTGYSVVLNCTFSKTSDTVGTGSESDAWFSDDAVDRFIELKFLSTTVAETPSTFYSWDVILPARYYTRTDGESGGNSVVVLEAHAFVDEQDLDGFFSSTLVNTVGDDDIGTVGS